MRGSTRRWYYQTRPTLFTGRRACAVLCIRSGTFYYFFPKKKCNITLYMYFFLMKIVLCCFFFCRKLHWLKRQLQLKGNNSFFLSLSFTLACILIFIDCDRIKINHFKCGLCTVYLQLFFFYFFFF